MPKHDEHGEVVAPQGKVDTRRATFGGAAGALVAVLAFLATGLLMAFGTIPGWAWTPTSLGVFAASACLIVFAFPRRVPSERHFARWFVVVGATVLGFLLGHYDLQWW